MLISVKDTDDRDNTMVINSLQSQTEIKTCGRERSVSLKNVWKEGYRCGPNQSVTSRGKRTANREILTFTIISYSVITEHTATLYP